MIKNIIFDMGNVLLRFDRELFIDRMGIVGEDKQALLTEVFHSLEWAMIDRGSITDKEAEERMCARLPQRLHEAVHKLVFEWDQPILPMPGMSELVHELKEKGYGLYLLSNASRRQHEYWDRVPGSECFDATVISADILLIKPQTDIFHYILTLYGLKAGECVFIDDSPLNVEASEYCGMPAIVFHGDSGRLRRDLREKGVDVREE